MIERAFGYDFETAQWIEYTSHSMLYDAIEMISFRMWALGHYDWDPQIYWEVACIPNMAKGLFFVEQFFSDDMQLKNLTPRYIYCPLHDAIEKISRNEADYTVTEEGCSIEGIPVWSSFIAMPDRETHPNTYQAAIQDAKAELPGDTLDAPFLMDEIAPVRWRIFQASPTEPLVLLGDVAVFSPQRGREWKKLSLTVSMKTRGANVSKCRIRTDRDVIWEGTWVDELNAWDCMGGEVDIPPIVVDAVLDTLRASTFLFTGIRPSVLSQMQGKAKIMAYIRRPFDLNSVFLKNFLCHSDAEFDSLFPYEEKNVYQRICRHLSIRPPKSLRRAYALNPYAIIWYMIFLQWGVCDINFMRPFFLLDIRIGPALINQFYFDRNAGRVEFSDTENWDMHCSWDAVVRYCRLLKHAKGERGMMRWLYRYSAMEFLSQEQQDTIEMFAEYEGFLSEGVIERLWKEGLTENTHVLISREVTALSNQCELDYEMPYDTNWMQAECDINDYKFRMIRNVEDLIVTGKEMKNCVASYHRRIMNGKSILFVVRYSGTLVACIELNRRYQIVQALGPENKRLLDEPLEVCRLWAAFCQFPIVTADLNRQG